MATYDTKYNRIKEWREKNWTILFKRRSIQAFGEYSNKARYGKQNLQIFNKNRLKFNVLAIHDKI